MNLTIQRNEISSDVKALSKKVEKFRADLLQLIQGLPDNPAIKRLSGNCYTISMKDLTQKFGRSVNSMWSAEAHDFKYQYKRIAVILNKVQFDDICNTLDRILEVGSYKTDKFHPGVIENIRKIWRS